MTQILVVDDNPMIRKLLGMALSRHFSVCEAQDSAAALSAIQRNKPEIIFLDIMMPSANEGLDLLDRLKSDPQTKDILVAMVTSRADPGDRALAMAKGADGFFSKPFHLDAITQWAAERLRPRTGTGTK
ncbi:two-component system response regulator [Rhodoferax lacus]|uniref:Two-component system response regulator n=1 Tax=Rhodoferax lacus TaxID=2184758 RepID=A0A3E1RBQ9_9BURK|nr:response regulator [Rhodoferax lacus]RFO96779.1 two-component system response regulator [Rhodoferax lacus]